MKDTWETFSISLEGLTAEAVRTAFEPEIRVVPSANSRNMSVTAGLEPTQKPARDVYCLWCTRTFTPRTTGGSAQRFCCTGHRQQFWIAARRWTMRAIEAGLLSVDCLKASHTSVHAA